MIPRIRPDGASAMARASVPQQFLADTTVESYGAELRRLLADDWRYAGTHVSGDGSAVRTVLVSPAGVARVVSVPVVDGAVPSIVDPVPAALWDEREAADLFAIQFAGHEPMRPLLNRSDLSTWTVPVQGEGTFQVAVGPIHAGIIESGHFRFHTIGELIVHVDIGLFYKHRGLELAAVGQTLPDALRYVARACAACSVANTVAYAQACEQVLGLVTPPDLSHARTVLLELERVWNHLNDVAAVCAGVGLAAGTAYFSELTEQARRLNGEFFGHRLLFGTVRVGSTVDGVAANGVAAVRTRLAALRQQVEKGWAQLMSNRLFQHRISGVGVLPTDVAARAGTVGPAARASGVAQDARTASPHLAYDGFNPVIPAPAEATCDARARVGQRARELWQSFDLLDELLRSPLKPAVAEPAGTGQNIAVGLVEGPRGVTSCVVESTDGRVSRLRLRTASFANWPAVGLAARRELLPDFPLINKSFELCYACVDR